MVIDVGTGEGEMFAPKIVQKCWSQFIAMCREILMCREIVTFLSMVAITVLSSKSEEDCGSVMPRAVKKVMQATLQFGPSS